MIDWKRRYARCCSWIPAGVGGVDNAASPGQAALTINVLVSLPGSEERACSQQRGGLKPPTTSSCLPLWPNLRRLPAPLFTAPSPRMRSRAPLEPCDRNWCARATLSTADAAITVAASGQEHAPPVAAADDPYRGRAELRRRHRPTHAGSPVHSSELAPGGRLPSWQGGCAAPARLTSPASRGCRATVGAAARGCDPRDRVRGVNRGEGCSGSGGGEVVAVQLGEVVGRHQ